MNEKIDILLSDFAYHVQKQNECIDQGDWRQGNKHAKKYIACVKEIFKSGDSAKNAMKKLFTHQDDAVRSMAACFLLKFCTEESLKILHEISKKPGLIGFEARECIKGWQEGDWHLDEF